MKDYFVALKPDVKDSLEDSKDSSFVTHIKDQALPKFSDEECYLDRFNTTDMMKSSIKVQSSKEVLDRFEEKPKGSFLTIQIDHFALDFKPI